MSWKSRPLSSGVTGDGEAMWDGTFSDHCVIEFFHPRVQTTGLLSCSSRPSLRLSVLWSCFHEGQARFRACVILRPYLQQPLSIIKHSALYTALYTICHHCITDIEHHPWKDKQAGAPPGTSESADVPDVQVGSALLGRLGTSPLQVDMNWCSMMQNDVELMSNWKNTSRTSHTRFFLNWWVAWCHIMIYPMLFLVPVILSSMWVSVHCILHAVLEMSLL